jgi:transcriptional regulator with XRE-family HTH domain
MRQGQVITPEDQQVGGLLREARLRTGLTQHELAARLGWSPDTLASYETGRRGLRVAQLLEVARALDVPPATLLVTDPQAITVLQRLGSNSERWGQVLLFLEALETGD